MGKGATQTSGGQGGNADTTLNGLFGIGGVINLGSYGGGGYGIVNIDHGSGGGGSSFISGHNGCDAIKEESTSDNIVHTGQNVHYSGYKFTDTVMIDGKGYNWTNIKGNYIGMPSHDGKNTISGNSGNGYAKITLVKKLISKY